MPDTPRPLPQADDVPKVDQERLTDATPPGRWHGWFSGRLPLETETAVFILVNVLDIFMTVTIVYLTHGESNAHWEGNPFARYFLDRWGFRGLAYYKMSMVAFVCVITQLIARRNVKVARRLLYGLTMIVGAVVIYSVYLIANAL